MARLPLALLHWAALRARASWAPRPLEDFAAGEVEGAEAGVRRFAHEEAHALDQGDLELRWEVHADPSSILAVDAEHEGGLRVLRCGESSLLLRVPAQKAAGAAGWRHVTASEGLHGCRHLVGKNLYRRVKSLEWLGEDAAAAEGDLLGSEAGGGRLVRLATEELASALHVFPRCSFSFRYMPVEAMEEEERAGRRLFPLFKNVEPKIKNSLTPVASNTNSMINFNVPHELSHLAWNWDYEANTTENPQLKYTYPGGQGYMRLYQPYLKAHFGISLNFTSEMKTFTQSPHVQVQGELKGVADFNADIATALGFDTDRSASVMDNLLDHIHIPRALLNMTGSKKMMSPLKFFMGSTPMTIHHSFTCKMKAYHIGQLKGSLRVGLATKLLLNGKMSFDTDTGLHTDFEAKSMNVHFTPPSWMLYTQHFELGMMLEPDVMFSGLFSGMDDMGLGFGLRPYLNISIMEQDAGSPDQAPLAVYPYRMMGLPSKKSYAVEVRANGARARTAEQISIGMTHFYDSVEAFQFGFVAHSALNVTGIEVAIFEEGVEVGSAWTTCLTELEGKCESSKMMVPVPVGNSTAIVQLTGFWKPNAVKSLEEKTKSIGLQFPMVTLSGPITEALKEEEAMDSARLVMKHSGQTLSVPLSKNNLNSTMLLESKMIYELGPVFLDAWHYAGQEDSKDPLTPIVEITVKSKVVASGRLPVVSWDQQDSLGGMSGLVGSVGGNFKASVTSIPVTASLYTPGQAIAVTGQAPPPMLGTAKFNFQMMPAAKAGFVVAPQGAEDIEVGKGFTVKWVVAGAEPAKEQTFYISTKTVAADGAVTEVNWLVTAHVHCHLTAVEELGRYLGSESEPCVFEAEVKFPGELEGHLGVVVVNWMDKQVNPYEMITPLVRFAGKGRRLDSANVNQWGSKSLGSTNSTHFGKKVKSKLHKLASHCSSQPLKYGVGAGMNLVEKMHGIMMPGTSMIGDSKPSKADWTSKPVPIFMLGRNQSEKKLSSLLPEALCKGGVCEGMMPGCQRQKASPRDIRKVEVQLSRRFMWKKHVGPKLRHVIAYALALFPTSVEIGNAELEEERRRTSTNTSTTSTTSFTVTSTTTTATTTFTTTSITTTITTTRTSTTASTSSSPPPAFLGLSPSEKRGVYAAWAPEESVVVREGLPPATTTPAAVRSGHRAALTEEEQQELMGERAALPHAPRWTEQFFATTPRRLEEGWQVEAEEENWEDREEFERFVLTLHGGGFTEEELRRALQRASIEDGREGSLGPVAVSGVSLLSSKPPQRLETSEATFRAVLKGVVGLEARGSVAWRRGPALAAGLAAALALVPAALGMVAAARRHRYQPLRLQHGDTPRRRELP